MRSVPAFSCLLYLLPSSRQTGLERDNVGERRQPHEPRWYGCACYLSWGLLGSRYDAGGPRFHCHQATLTALAACTAAASRLCCLAVRCMRFFNKG